MFNVERSYPTSIEALLKEEEGQRLDFKSKRIEPRKLSRILAAFANSDGGEVYIGIEDEKSWDGFEKPEDANEIIEVFSKMFPLGDFARGVFVSCDGYSGYVLRVRTHNQ